MVAARRKCGCRWETKMQEQGSGKVHHRCKRHREVRTAPRSHLFAFWGADGPWKVATGAPVDKGRPTPKTTKKLVRRQAVVSRAHASPILESVHVYTVGSLLLAPCSASKCQTGPLPGRHGYCRSGFPRPVCLSKLLNEAS